MRQKLIEEIKKQGKPYGLYFEDIQGGFTLTQRSLPQAFQVLPVLVWRVYPDGRPDELVRGVDIVGTPLAALNRILVTGDKTDVFNGICGAESGQVPVVGRRAGHVVFRNRSAEASAFAQSPADPAIARRRAARAVRERARRADDTMTPTHSAISKRLGEVRRLLLAARSASARVCRCRPAKDRQASAAADPVLLRHAQPNSIAPRRMLKLDQVAAPYYIEYRIFDIEQYAAESAFGALRGDVRARIRVLRVVVRVGRLQAGQLFRPGTGRGRTSCRSMTT